MAASWLRMLSLEQIETRLADRFRMLAGGARGRHATLLTTCDWSWELLNPWERSAMAQVSVFDGGFTPGSRGGRHRSIGSPRRAVRARYYPGVGRPELAAHGDGFQRA